jgi:predicted HAD superfamily phosphohydrolase YqeG
MKEKSLAMVGDKWRTSVMTGKATAPPPSAVAPPMKDPTSMVMVIG